MTDKDTGGTPEANGLPAYMPFGDGPTQQIPVEWAEAILRRFRDEDPERFGYYLQLAAGLDVTAPTRRRHRATGA